VRKARADDGGTLAAIDRATWAETTSPAPFPAGGWAFFKEGDDPGDVLVAELDGEVAGYVRLGRATPLPASDHVVVVNGFAVDPARQRQGVGRALLEAALRETAARGARRLTLRVLAPNTAARRLYESCGFRVEGVLKGEFHLGGRDVDDVLMAREVPSPGEPTDDGARSAPVS
jgi:ribosomal protein S18 acetylase RimI-like enzyme